MAISTPGSTEFPGGRVLPDETFDDGLLNDEDDDDEEEEGETDMSGYSPEQSFLESARKKKFLLDDQTDEEDVEDGLPVRRSRRATRGVRLAFWKNERPLYKRGEFVGLEPVKPTPKKTTKPRSRLMKNSDKTGGQSSKTIGSWRKDNNNDDDINNDNDDTPAAAVRIPSNREYINRDTVLNMDIWDDFKGTPTEAHIFCSHESVYPPAKLPISGMFSLLYIFTINICICICNFII